MKILFLRPRFEMGGIFINSKLLFEGLLEKKHDVFLVTTDSAEIQTFTKLGVHVFFLPLFPSSFINLFRSIISLVALIKTNKIEIMHSNHRFTHIVGRIASIICRVKFTVSIRELLPKFNYLSSIWLINNQVIIPSFAMKRSILHDHFCNESNLHVIYNPVNDKYILSDVKIERLKKNINYNKDFMYIGVVGRLSREKGFNYFIDSIKYINYDKKKLVFLIVGDGLEKESLIEQAEEIDACIQFLGSIPDNYELISLLDIVVVPSLRESFGLVALEAMYLQKPVIASNVGGLPELIKNNVTGVLIKPASAEQIALAVDDLLNDVKKRTEIASNAKDFCNYNFSTEVFVNKHNDFFLSLLHREKNL